MSACVWTGREKVGRLSMSWSQTTGGCLRILASVCHDVASAVLL